MQIRIKEIFYRGEPNGTIKSRFYVQKGKLSLFRSFVSGFLPIWQTMDECIVWKNIKHRYEDSMGGYMADAVFFRKDDAIELAKNFEKKLPKNNFYNPDQFK